MEARACEQLNIDSLIKMLPRMWSFHAVKNGREVNDIFLIAWKDDILSTPTCPHTIDEVKTVSLILSPFKCVKAAIRFIFSEITDGYLLLMPGNEKEYILSLGAKACVERILGNKVKISISSPGVMGAFGISVAGTSDKSSEISFVFGEKGDYMYCNLLVDGGIYEVQQLFRTSIVPPMEILTELQHIVKGCMVRSLIREGLVIDHLLLDMFPYKVSLLLKENGRISNIYNCIGKPTNIPTRKGDKVINVDITTTLSFLVGSNELIEDVLTRYDTPNGIIETFIELDADMNVIIKIKSNMNDYKINVGELIEKKYGTSTQ